MSDPPAARTGAELVYDALASAGVEVAFGVPGHQTIPLDLLLDERDAVTPVYARHETAIPHMAWGHYEAGGGPAATMSVPGPGDTNAMHGLRNALDDRVPLVHLSADVAPETRGRGAIHELEPETLDNVVKRNEVVTSPHELPERLARGLGAMAARPAGPVRFSLPASYLEEPVDEAGLAFEPEALDYDPQAAYDAAADRLADAERAVVYLDAGARRSPDATAPIRELVERLDAPVVSSYKGVGLVPSDDPRYLGPGGLAILPGAQRVLERADVVLALGGYFDGPSTGFWTQPMGETLVHVTVEPDRLDASYEADVPVVADPGDAARALLDRLGDSAGGWDGARIGEAVTAEYHDHLEALGLYEDRSPAPSPAVFRALRGVLPPETIAAIDIGHFRTWALATFDLYEPDTLVTPGSWTGMGVGLPGAIGAKLARPDRPVVAFTGDGCLLMCLQELHTAAHYDLDVTTVVFNNADYAIISKEETLEATKGPGFFGWESPDFVAIAEGFGCHGFRATSPGEAADAVADALAADGPALVDVAIDPEETSPVAASSFETAVDPG